MEVYLKALLGIFNQSGFVGLTWGNVIMIGVSAILLYLAIGKDFEPLLLVPI
ncbi:MAG TPA: glutaconyl-CoA decarboxylase subunit beta, partial [Acetomicrobium flavidum]|nr:glutaconyl-CoA decarboxylase subunit beta [Acetomicrobium flavidum]